MSAQTQASAALLELPPAPEVSKVPLAVDLHEREKDFLTAEEVARLVAAAGHGRHGVRDQALFRLMFRHGLRVSEAAGLCLDDLRLAHARIWIPRLKGGLSTSQPLEGDDLRALRRWLAERERRWRHLPWVFVSERGTPLTRQAIWYLVKRAAQRADLEASPHSLRHACGYELARRGVASRVMMDYLGHRSPEMSAHYTRTAGRSFEGLWR